MKLTAGNLEQRGFPAGRKALLAWAELTGLWTLVFSQQTFERVAWGPEAYTQVGADRLDVFLIIILVAVMPPTVAWLVELGIYRLHSAGAASVFHAALFGSAIGLFYWQFAVSHQLSFGVRYPSAIILVTGGALLYLKSKVVKNFGELLSLATPVVIVIFCLTYPTSVQILPAKKPQSIAEIRSDTPVLLLIFDEFSLDTLLNREGKIDARLFPNFAKLARRSTWYPNARTVASYTDRAVPAIMSGRLPDGDVEPSLSTSTLPDNLCALLEQGGYKLNTVEQITSFCGPRNTRSNRIRALISPALVSGVLPPSSLLPTVKEKLVAPQPEEGRAEQLDEFIEGITEKSRTFHFIHAMLPHRPWSYFPDGHAYEPAPDRWTMQKSARDVQYQQLMLQTAFVDSEIGSLIARMKDSGIWDKSLLIVTADHGFDMSAYDQSSEESYWDPRDLYEASAGTILPIPLFVKLPGQLHGKVETRDVTSVDITPTILEQLNVSLQDPDEIDGRSLQGNPRGDSDSITAFGTTEQVSVSRREYAESRVAARRLRNKLFGSGSFFALGGHHRLIGSSVTAHRKLVALDSSAGSSVEDANSGPDELAGRWEFTLNRQPPSSSSAVAVAVNGTISATIRPQIDPASGSWTVSVVLPSKAFSNGGNRIALYSISKRRGTLDNARVDRRSSRPGFGRK